MPYLPSTQPRLALGLGDDMVGAEIFMGWTNSTGGITLSQRTATAYARPGLSPAQTATLIPLAVSKPSWANIAFSFRRPLTPAQGKSITATSPYVFAYSGTRPTAPDNPASGFEKHDEAGHINNLDVTKASAGGGNGGAAAGGSTSGQGKPAIELGDVAYTTILKAHGALMFIAWGIAPFLGIFIARYLKDALGIWWYRLHVGLMLGVTGALTMASFILILLYVAPPHFDTTDSAHRPMGLAIVIAMIIQIILGFVCNALWSPDRPAVPIWDKAHWWLGRLTFLLAIINMYLGIDLYGTYGDIKKPLIAGLYWAWIAVGILGLVAGNFIFGQRHHVKGHTEYGVVSGRTSATI
ncbi:DOMON domain-containing protein frrs1L [Borealophlyctis nickersoniae]|nr:DOMON domain-containing protein frrs1L [Borealophlyctis nickersoniae]